MFHPFVSFYQQTQRVCKAFQAISFKGGFVFVENKMKQGIQLVYACRALYSETVECFLFSSAP